MYDQFYGFTGRPFQLSPDPRFYFESGTHRKAMSYLGYGLAQGEGIIIITGESGTGKSTLIGHLLGTIDGDRLNAVKLVAAQVEGDDLLSLAAEQFGLEGYRGGQDDLVQALEIQLKNELIAGRRTLLIIDEAQNLSVAAWEQLSRLSALQLDHHPLMQIFLLGHAEFRHVLTHSPSLAALRQRVIAAHHLEPIEAEEIEPYIFHRLGKVGWTGMPTISSDGFEALYAHSEGVPRRLNALMTKVLMFAALDELTRITAQNVRDVVAQLDNDQMLVSGGISGGGSDDDLDRDADPSAAPLSGIAAVDEISELHALRDRVSQLEARALEQDEALRRVINLLIGWVEPQNEAVVSAELPQDDAPKTPENADIWAA